MRALVQRVGEAAVEIDGEQVFTLYGDARKGNRPSYAEAAPGAEAEPLYERFCERLGAARGVFGARMAVSLVNDGPVTLLVEA